jgi:hypothetical protein
MKEHLEIIELFLEFIKQNKNNPCIRHVSKELFYGTGSIGISLSDYNKEFSIIFNEGVIFEVLNLKKNDHDFSISLRSDDIHRLINIYHKNDYISLVKEAQSIPIPLGYKLRFGKVYLTSKQELGKCKELWDKFQDK